MAVYKIMKDGFITERRRIREARTAEFYHTYCLLITDLTDTYRPYLY